MTITIEDNKLYVSDVPESFGNEFIYKYPHQYRDPGSNRMATELIERVAFYPTDKGWEFETPQWIYIVMKHAKKCGLTLSNPEVLDRFINKGGLVKNPYHLWDSQVECLNHMTSMSHGMGILRTGAGKTTMISVLAKNMLDQNKKVLVMAPTNGVLHEIRDRFSSDFDIDCKYYFDPEKNIQFVNPKGLFRSNKFWLHDPYWQDIDCIIMDEVENCMNEKFIRVLERIPMVKNVYGFSGTANKITAERMDFVTGGTHNDNELRLLNNLGWTSWYEKPTDRVLNLVRIYPALNVPPLETQKEKDDAFNQIPIKMAGMPEWHQMIERLFTDGHVRNLYIPYVSRVAIDIFLGICKRPVGLITGSGFQYRFKPEDEIQNCTLDELKDLAREEKIDIILGSRSSFAGIDFPPNWDSSLANCIGSKASSLVQAAGRVARAKEFNMFYCMGKGHVPIYNPQVRQGVKLMRNYYSEGEVNEKKIYLK